MSSKTWTIEVLQEYDIEETARHLARNFSLRDPITYALGMTAEEEFIMECDLLAQMVPQGLSLIAKDTDSQRIVGAIIMGDYVIPVEPTIDYSPKYRPMFALFDAVEEPFKRHSESYSAGQIAYVDYWSQDPDYPLPTLAFELWSQDPDYPFPTFTLELCDAALKHLRSFSYQMLVATATSPVTQRLLLEIKWQEIHRIALQDFQFESTFPLAHLKTPKNIIFGRLDL